MTTGNVQHKKTPITPEKPKKRTNSKKDCAIHSVYSEHPKPPQVAIHSVPGILHLMYISNRSRTMQPSTSGHPSQPTHSGSVPCSRRGPGKTYHSNRKCAVFVHPIHTNGTVAPARGRSVTPMGGRGYAVVHRSVCHPPCRATPGTYKIAGNTGPGLSLQDGHGRPPISRQGKGLEGPPPIPLCCLDLRRNQEGEGGLRRRSPPLTHFSGTSFRFDVWDGQTRYALQSKGLAWTAARFDAWDGWCWKVLCATELVWTRECDGWDVSWTARLDRAVVVRT